LRFVADINDMFGTDSNAAIFAAEGCGSKLWREIFINQFACITQKMFSDQLAWSIKLYGY
jgi:hypothetical protein|tara:strand:- start:240 stop:419 length:180 start_codon:yes stop_codon:yes gene_type:complete